MDEWEQKEPVPVIDDLINQLRYIFPFLPPEEPVDANHELELKSQATRLAKLEESFRNE